VEGTMTPASIKVVIANFPALAAKYGPSGLQLVQAALKRLINADAARHLQTQVFDIADPSVMSKIGGPHVLGTNDDRGAKLSVDAICKALNPDYVMLLDGPDVVPHVGLSQIPGLIDGDRTIDSDLPYASPAGFSRNIASYLAVTRVVGRLPAARGETDPNKLIELINFSIDHRTSWPNTENLYFAISAEVWKVSTQLSLGSLFGNHTALFVSPTDGHTGIDGALANPVHFINCHGATNDWRFYGEGANQFPIALDTPGFSSVLVGQGAVVAAECCYGAQLYNYRLSNIHPPLCLTYLWKGASAVLGSTTISYGQSASNGQADLMAQEFVRNVIAGASSGRALLQARQTFVQSQMMSNPCNLKTLAQFLLLGDPSLQPFVLQESELEVSDGTMVSHRVV